MKTEVEQSRLLETGEANVANEAKGERVGLCRPWWTAWRGNWDGDVQRLVLNNTMADRVLWLMEMAQESMRRGNGWLGRLQATAARHYRRLYFPSAQRRARAAAMEQPCPSVVVTGAGALEADYEGLYLAHFVAGGREAA